MTEELVTRLLVAWLKNKGWDVLSYDFPGSGTGRPIRPVGCRYKNRGSVTADILAVSGTRALWIESKDRYDSGDVRKLQRIRGDAALVEAIGNVARVVPGELAFGLGMPVDHAVKAQALPDGVDFIIGVDSRNCIVVLGTV